MHRYRGRIVIAFILLCAARICLAGEERPRVRYDPLPLRFAALNRYDAMALEPYREDYDGMLLHEKARVYSQAFEFMHNRPPNFSPAVRERIRRSEDFADARSSFELRKYLYKEPPVPAEDRPPPPPVDPNEKILSAIPMPWAAEEPPAPEGEDEEDVQAAIDSLRMESLRPGSLRIARPEQEERPRGRQRAP